MDLPALTPVITKLLEQGVLVVILLYAVVTLYKKVMEIQESRVKDSLEREKTITIALNTAVEEIGATRHTLQEVGSTMKTIMITMDKPHEKN